MIIRTFMAFVFFAMCTACATPGADLQPFPINPTQAASGYKLGSGDKIRLVVGGFQEMSDQYNVSDLGTISVPMIGVVQVEGRSTGELEREISALLVERDLAVTPDVNVQVEQYRPFFVMGQVNQPGAYPFVPGMTVLNAVSIAGGHTFRAETENYGITRRVDGETVQGKGVADTMLLPGDTIIVYETWF
ncbi:polysaccharide biosynthesis/export family protein [Aurantiacibacter poecillastricola]|uniref:polysaccharide biosynthesis/export family protein n=1 Tax=Aurantiacibacter poecillastricola TaxID=3064385 RepID=UPI0027401958|nr:polysaccharide biosynthesis/export family protein [Aurantiacibacter sp. 219JJ12-13]MDP5259993.1 polysaccharide biosynthesis/export family protein [Aurantiacibacter sp. 219JJ12-13]